MIAGQIGAVAVGCGAVWGFGYIVGAALPARRRPVPPVPGAVLVGEDWLAVRAGVRVTLRYRPGWVRAWWWSSWLSGSPAGPYSGEAETPEIALAEAVRAASSPSGRRAGREER